MGASNDPNPTLNAAAKHFIGGTAIGGLLVSVFLVLLGYVQVSDAIVASLVTFIITKLGDLAYIVVTDYFPRGKVVSQGASTVRASPERHPDE